MPVPELMPTTIEGKVTKVIEEMSECIQALCKLQRFGPGPHEYAGITYDNLADFNREYNELQEAVAMMRKALS